jgi:hypothetical protein
VPVKKILKNYRSLTGFIVAQNGNPVHYQSSLERDLIVTADFLSHSIVERFEDQPCKIKYSYGKAPLRPYTPDLCVWFKLGGGPFIRRCSTAKPWLIETKYRSDLVKNWSDYRPRFRAAIRFAALSGYAFHLITERYVRTPLLRTAQFLRPFRRIPLDPEFATSIIGFVKVTEIPTPATTLAALVGNDEKARLRALPQFWRLLAFGELSMNLKQPLTMNTRVWQRGR